MAGPKVSLVIEHAGNTVTVTPSGEGMPDSGNGEHVAGFDFGRLARIAGCVVACMAGTPTAATHGQEQPGDGQGAAGQLVDVKAEQPASNARPARPGR